MKSKLKSSQIQIVQAICLTLIWTILWGELNLPNVILGLIVSLFIAYFFSMPKIPIKGAFYPIEVLKLTILFFYNLLISSFHLTILTYKTATPKTEFLRIKYSISSEMILALFVDYINLIPGTLFVGLNRKGKSIKLHILDSSSKEKIISTLKDVYKIERQFIKAFEKDSRAKTMHLNKNIAHLNEIIEEVKAKK